MLSGGLYLIVQPRPSGSLSSSVRTKLDGKAAKITLGRYDERVPAWNRSTGRQANRSSTSPKRGHWPSA